MNDTDDLPPLLEPIAPSTVPPFLREIEPERMRMPLEPGAHGPVAEIYRQATLSALHALSEEVATLSDAVRAVPDDDELADKFIGRLLAAQNLAGVFLQRFRGSREAQGQA